VRAYSDAGTDKGVCFKEDNCKAGDVIILEFQTITKPNVVGRVARLCDFDKTVYTYQTPQKQLKIACVYIGEKRLLRKTEKDGLSRP
jgi:hypothetical protein